MKKIFILLVALFAMLFIGCMSNTSSAYEEPGVTVNLAEREYEIIDHVSVSGTKRNILGLFWWGGVTYEDLLIEARKMGADDVMNIYEDKSQLTIAIFYSQFNHTLTATAIKYR